MAHLKGLSETLLGLLVITLRLNRPAATPPEDPKVEDFGRFLLKGWKNHPIFKRVTCLVCMANITRWLGMETISGWLERWWRMFFVCSPIFFAAPRLPGTPCSHKIRVCHNHLSVEPDRTLKNRRNPTSPRDNACQSLGARFSHLTRFLWWTPKIPKPPKNEL